MEPEYSTGLVEENNQTQGEEDVRVHVTQEVFHDFFGPAEFLGLQSYLRETKVFGVGLEGPKTSSKNTWSPRDYKILTASMIDPNHASRMVFSPHVAPI